MEGFRSSSPKIKSGNLKNQILLTYLPQFLFKRALSKRDKPWLVKNMKANGEDYPIYEMENTIHVPNHQPDDIHLQPG
jgi:hypothetical protein